MSKHIVFINGWGVPGFIAKSRFGWNDELWEGYSRIYLPSKAPRSDAMVRDELFKLEKFINSLDNPIVMGQSLGAWWAANLACQPGIKIKNLILFTPLANTSEFAIFNNSPLYYPYNRIAHVRGPHRVLVCFASEDIVVPAQNNAYRLLSTFNAMDYKLDGGHFSQPNHLPCLKFIKDWVEIE